MRTSKNRGQGSGARGQLRTLRCARDYKAHSPVPSSLTPDPWPLAPRPAFTLVEMMVAMTLTIFVMVILSQCFVQGLETFSGLKVIGDMQEELRAAVTVLREDLSQDHFEAKRRLSDPVSSFTSNPIREGFFVIGQGYPNNLSMKTFPLPPALQIAPAGVEVLDTQTIPPRYYASPPWPPGTPFSIIDPDGIGSTRATDHWLHFTVKLRGNDRTKFFSAVDTSSTLGAVASTYFNQPTDALFQDSVVNNIYFSPWAEVAYFLVQTGTTDRAATTGGAGTPLYALYRSQFLVFPNTNLTTVAPATPAPAPNAPTKGGGGALNIANFQSFSCNPWTLPANGNVEFYNPTDLASSYDPITRYYKRAFNPYTSLIPPGAPGSATAAPTVLPARAAAASTLVLSNVLSFQIQVLPVGGTDFQDMVAISQAVMAPPDPDPPKQPHPLAFDTANYGTPMPLPKPPYTPNIPAKTITPPVLNFSIQGLQITLRIWDPKSQSTRQVTFMQDM